MVCVGIAGPSGAGKTFLARHLAGALPECGVLAFDSYYRDLSHLPPADRDAWNFDSPDAIDWPLFRSHVRQLLAGGRVDVPRYRFSTHSREPATVPLGPCGALVIEGLFALWDELVRGRLSVGVFVDLAERQCLDRRISRDTATRGRTRESVRAQWRRHVAPMYREHVLPTLEMADIVVGGTSPPGESVAAILRRLDPAGARPRNRRPLRSTQ